MSIQLPVSKAFETPEALSEALATRIAEQLQAAIDSRGKASLVVSGGRTPIGLFEKLRKARIQWGDVYITLADERWVDVSDDASNEKLVKAHLLKDAAAAAHFRGLKTPHARAEEGVAMASDWLSNLPSPFDVVVLGMGNDGHTASLFPCSAELAEGLDPANPARLLAVQPTTAPHQRISLTLPAILNSRQIYLHLQGPEKAQVLAEAASSDDVTAMPIRAVLAQKGTPVDIYLSQR
ncbi:6-phosphogluconolactonase [Gallaecimonas sp. GXIMD4217]|uniref:6-phosphogluconolactonase n=1 Tax=Gallaecimonas sp. GXIMD4217 TaxID=3131927 RepID=UPI00311B1680